MLKAYFKGASWTERLGLGLSLVITLALFGAVLGPATDADSLEYHLGVPLDWLRHGGAYARPDWFHARLAGLGEAINMLGLAMGTDNLGAVFQAAGLVVAIDRGHRVCHDSVGADLWHPLCGGLSRDPDLGHRSEMAAVACGRADRRSGAGGGSVAAV